MIHVEKEEKFIVSFLHIPTLNAYPVGSKFKAFHWSLEAPPQEWPERQKRLFTPGEKLLRTPMSHFNLSTAGKTTNYWLINAKTVNCITKHV